MASQDIYAKLRMIQSNLKAPKDQYNDFSKFNYRSAEDILSAVKPLLNEHGLALLVTDDVKLIGDRYYVCATASLLDTTQEGQIDVSAYAREDETKKGMDGSQITGAASSYARKYALNGLFAIDDTKDADSYDNRGTTTSTKRPTVSGANSDKPSPQDRKVQLKRQLTGLMAKLNVKPDEFADFYQTAIGKEKPETVNDVAKAIKHAETLVADEEDRAKELEGRV